jgi:2-dehydro-3-deoxygluconokinase
MTGVVLTAGESMGLLDPDGELAYGCTVRLRMAGAESNFAIALSRLGVAARWVSRVGCDPIGDLIVAAVEAEGVDTSGVVRDPGAPTGMYYKAREGAVTRVHYYRHGSAASRLTGADVPDAMLDDVAHVHLTGITMGLSPGAADLVVGLAERARARGIGVTFDLNWRAALWPDPAVARAAYERVLPSADWVLCGVEEGRLVFGGDTPAAIIAALRAAGAGDAVVRVGARGAVLLDRDDAVVIPPPRLIDVIDEVGAGDAFAAGFVFALLGGEPAPAAVRVANRLAAASLEGTGDWETLPHRADLALPTGQES